MLQQFYDVHFYDQSKSVPRWVPVSERICFQELDLVLDAHIIHIILFKYLPLLYFVAFLLVNKI